MAEREVRITDGKFNGNKLGQDSEDGMNGRKKLLEEAVRRLDETIGSLRRINAMMKAEERRKEEVMGTGD